MIHFLAPFGLTGTGPLFKNGEVRSKSHSAAPVDQQRVGADPPRSGTDSGTSSEGPEIRLWAFPFQGFRLESWLGPPL